MNDAFAVNDVATVRRGVLRLARRLRVERGEGGLSATKVSLLGHLYRRGPLSPKTLAELDRVRVQSLTRVLADLQRDDLVSRTRDPADGRQSLIALTPAGAALLEQHMRESDAWLAQAMDHLLSPAERQLLHLAGELLTRLAEG
ncbi:MarR family transcriptional regulator [Streptosporangiaceae bacterium NEAU-GS5]|nr:MarR family transcriptional regulator [Streptosporangiaceae bacterium NEAU-GS5]